MKRLLPALSLLMFSLLAGCVTTRSFKVDAITSAINTRGFTYRIVPANPDTSPTDLRFMEAASFVEKALALQGYKRTPTDDAGSDMIIALDSVIGEPENITRSRAQPLYAEEGGFYRVARVKVRDRDTGLISYMRTTVWVPPYSRMIGTVDTAYTETVYEKRLSISAYSTKVEKEGDDLTQLWSVVVTSRDTNGDLRSVLAHMALAAARYVGSDTGGQVNYRIGDDSEELMSVRGTSSAGVTQ